MYKRQDMGWSSDSIDLDDWMKIYCEARYGGYPDAMEEAWKLFRKTAYSSCLLYTSTTVNVVMKENAVSLEDVVVVGYGVQKKVNVTGAVSMVCLLYTSTLTETCSAGVFQFILIKRC